MKSTTLHMFPSRTYIVVEGNLAHDVQKTAILLATTMIGVGLHLYAHVFCRLSQNPKTTTSVQMETS